MGVKWASNPAGRQTKESDGGGSRSEMDSNRWLLNTGQSLAEGGCASLGYLNGRLDPELGRRLRVERSWGGSVVRAGAGRVDHRSVISQMSHRLLAAQHQRMAGVVFERRLCVQGE